MLLVAHAPQITISALEDNEDSEGILLLHCNILYLTTLYLMPFPEEQCCWHVYDRLLWAAATSKKCTPMLFRYDISSSRGYGDVHKLMCLSWHITVVGNSPTWLVLVQRISISSDSSVPPPFIAFWSSWASYSQGRHNRANAVFSKFPLSSPFSTSSKS